MENDKRPFPLVGISINRVDINEFDNSRERGRDVCLPGNESQWAEEEVGGTELATRQMTFTKVSFTRKWKLDIMYNWHDLTEPF